MAVPTYLITKDLTETLRNKYRLSLSENTNSQVKKLGDEFVEKFWDASELPKGIKRCELEAGELSNKIMSLLRKTELDYISLDRVYIPVAPAYLEVTRKTNSQTGEVTIAERPGASPLEKQISSMKEYEQVAVADVGAFEGTTLLEICKMLDAQGTSVNEIYLGVSGNRLNAKINGGRELNVVREFNLYEWVELRDFVGFDGRSNETTGGVRSKRVYMPYWQNLEEWASIPKNSEPRVRTLCMRYNAELKDLVINEVGSQTWEEKVGLAGFYKDSWKFTTSFAH